MTTTHIEWADVVWNPTTGCDKVSPGCDHCYAMTMAKRLKAMGQPKYQTDGDPRTSGPGFGVAMHPDVLGLPLRWRQPKRIFVNSMSDLFHAKVSDEFIARVFAVMAVCPQHTFQCLTKRPGRMKSLLNSQVFHHRVAQALDALHVDRDHDLVERWEPIPGYDGYDASSHGRIRSAAGVLATSMNPATGREAVTLWNHGHPKTLPVHRLVLIAHNGARDDAAEACHRNGDKTDNRLANRRWGSRSDNQQEKVRHGARGGPQKLTPGQVDLIRAERRQGGETQQQVADRHGISRSLVSMIENGKAWAEPELAWPLPNVWLGTSTEDQKTADLRIRHLLETEAAVHWISAEPLLGPIDLGAAALVPYEREQGGFWRYDARTGVHGDGKTWVPAPPAQLDWVVVGGESGPGARPMDLAWATSLRDQCARAGIPFHFKQGGSVLGREWGGHSKGGDPASWPESFPREYPEVAS